MANIRVHVYVSGVVQGVFFRTHTRRKALQLGVTGWVKNLRDGRVEAVFEGDEDRVNAMVEWCKTGPPGAFVEKVEVNLEPPTGEIYTFEIVY